MDSAYQSQSGASRRGAKNPETHSHDSRSRMSNQYVGSEMYSPTLSSDNYNAFPEALDMSHLQQSSTIGTWEATEETLAYANCSTAQDYAQYSTANMPRFTPSTVNGSPQWATTETPFQNNPFAFTSWPTSQTTNETMFNPAASQRNWHSASFDATERPTAVRSSSSYTLQEESRRASAHDANFGAFVGTPTSTTSVHFPQALDFEDTKSGSMPQSLEDSEDILSQSETAESKLEEERTKVARNHPLYQQTPDKDGKYHCPEEGKTGCSHKPTSLKCNYE
jgi:hypothetical protein